MPCRIRSWLAWLLPAVLLLVAPPARAAAPRLALVVGNAAYPARPLATAGNDAALVAQALAQTGFDVTAAHDLAAAPLRATLAAFLEAARAAGPDTMLFVYLTGYGVQYGGNFLVPVDARLIHDDDVPLETASLDEFVGALAAVPAKARLVVLDASRAQPFATVDEMPLAPGLGLMTAPKDTIVAFAAAPDMVAPDDLVPYGAYARALAETIAAPGLSPNALFDRVRLRVGMLTNGEQVPWDDGAIADGVALTPSVAPAPVTPASATPPNPPPNQLPAPQPPVPALSPDTAYSVVVARDTLASYAEFLRIVPEGPLATRIRVLQAVRREATIWQAAAAADDPRAAWTYMRRYPRAPHRSDARRRLAALHAALDPPPRFEPYMFLALPPPPAIELPLVAAPEQALRGLPPIPPPPANLLPPADPAYYDELPMPAPALAGLLPIAPPLPGAAEGEPGRIAQERLAQGPTLAETLLTPNGSASITLADAAGPIAELVAADTSGDARTLIETGPAPAPDPVEAAPAKGGPTPAPGAAKPKSELKAPKAEAPALAKAPEPPVLSRTTVARTADGVTITQYGPDGALRLEIATHADGDGGRTTRVRNGRDETLAGWRRDARGIVVAREVAAIAGPATPPVPEPPVAPAPVKPSPPAPVIVPRPAPPSAPVEPSIPVAPAAPPRAESPMPTPPPAPPQPPLPVPQAQAPPPPAPAPAPPEPVPTAATASPDSVPLPPPRPAAVASKPSPTSRRPKGAPAKTPSKKAPAARKRPPSRHGRRP